MYKKIPAKCEDSRVSGSICSNDTVQAVSYTGPEGTTIYVGLCDRHSRQLLKLLPTDAKPLSVEFAERIMNNYESSTIAQTPTTEDTTVTITVDTTPAANTIVIPSPTSAPVDLLQVAADLSQQASNGNGHVQQVIVDVSTPEPAQPVKHVPCAIAVECLEKAAIVRAQAALVPAVAKELIAAAEKLEAQAAKAQAAADEEANRPKVWPLDGKALLRLALLQCGVLDLDAINRAIDAGLLSIPKPATSKKEGGESKEASSTPRPPITHATSRGHGEDIKNRVLALKAQGLGDNAIAKEVGLSASTVYSMCKRAAAAA
jgi:hypothetical protein